MCGGRPAVLLWLLLQKYVLRSYPLGTLLTQASVARIDAAIARVVANDDSPARL